MEKIRGFEVVKEFENKDINLPKRGTKYAAGYDIEAAEDIIIPAFKLGQKPTMIKTGLKAYFQNDEVLCLVARSSLAKKKGLMLSNNIGIIDADYYNNPENEGHIMFAVYNLFEEETKIKKGERIGQGVFQKYLLVDNDDSEGERQGGYGSTGI